MSPRLLLGIGVYLFALTYTGITNYFDTDDRMNLYGAWHSLPDQVRPAASLFFGCFQGSMWMIYAILCATFLYSALLIAIEKPGWWPALAPPRSTNRPRRHPQLAQIKFPLRQGNRVRDR